jgi:hypothetical protein
MARTNALPVFLIAGLIAVLAATPGMASYGNNQPVTPITDPVQSSDRDRGYESVNAITGPVGETPAALVSRHDGYSSPNALVGAEPTPASSVEIRQADGFDWGDALIGALVAIAMMLLALGGARVVGQARRRTVESSA